jgi:hypothetical protein
MVLFGFLISHPPGTTATADDAPKQKAKQNFQSCKLPFPYFISLLIFVVDLNSRDSDAAHRQHNGA